MKSMTASQIEARLLEPAVARRAALPAEIHEAEEALSALIASSDYDDDAADAAELHRARLLREQARMNVRISYLSRRHSLLAGRGEKATMSV